MSRRQFYLVKCAGCGKNTEIPFKPDDKRPVYCPKCYREMKDQESA